MGGEVITKIDDKIYLYQNDVFTYLMDGSTLFSYDNLHFITDNKLIKIETKQVIKEYAGVIKSFQKYGEYEFYQIDNSIYLNDKVILEDALEQELQFHNNYGNCYDFFVFADGTYGKHDHRGYDYFQSYVMQWNPISNVCNPTWIENGEFKMTTNTMNQGNFEKSFRNDAIETDDYIFMLTGAVIDKKNKTLRNFYYDVPSKTWMKGQASALWELNTKGNLFVNYGRVLGTLSNGLHIFSLGHQNWDASKVGFFTYNVNTDTTGIVKELDKTFKITGSILIGDSVMYCYRGDILLLNTDTGEEVKIKTGSTLKGFIL